MKIKGIYNIQQIDMEIFTVELIKKIKLFQEDGQEVEVQYKTHMLDNGQYVYQALIIGRVEGKDNEYLEALREVDTHIRSTKHSIPYIIETLKNILPEYQR